MVINPTYNESLEVLLVTAYAYGKYLGHLDVVFDDDGLVTSYDGNPIVLDSGVIPGTCIIPSTCFPTYIDGLKVAAKFDYRQYM